MKENELENKQGFTFRSSLFKLLSFLPNRFKTATVYRKILNRVEESLILPIQNPKFYQLIAIFLSFSLLFIRYKPTIALIILIILLCDWCDGAAARKNGLESREGFISDLIVDRISEGFMFFSIIDTSVGKIFFLLLCLNLLLSYYSINNGKHLVLALRFFYVVYLLISLPSGLWI